MEKCLRMLYYAIDSESFKLSTKVERQYMVRALAAARRQSFETAAVKRRQSQTLERLKALRDNRGHRHTNPGHENIWMQKAYNTVH